MFLDKKIEDDILKFSKFLNNGFLSYLVLKAEDIKGNNAVKHLGAKFHSRVVVTAFNMI